ncbi:MAG: NAD-dependent epimerase/dehydratase family protein, partial [Solirubrobacteraceae bacterium]
MSKRVAVTGASGFLGTALKQSLRADGHEVSVLVRHETAEAGEDSWDPGQGLVDPDFLAGADAVVCLSGVGVGDRRWTESYKQLI